MQKEKRLIYYLEAVGYSASEHLFHVQPSQKPPVKPPTAVHSLPRALSAAPSRQSGPPAVMHTSQVLMTPDHQNPSSGGTSAGILNEQRNMRATF